LFEADFEKTSNAAQSVRPPRVDSRSTSYARPPQYSGTRSQRPVKTSVALPNQKDAVPLKIPRTGAPAPSDGNYALNRRARVGTQSESEDMRSTSSTAQAALLAHLADVKGRLMA